MASTLDERIKNMALPVDLSKDKFRAQYGTFQSEDSQSGVAESISPTIEQLLQEMTVPVAEPIATIDSKIINKIVKAYQLKLKSDSEARGVKRKRESDAEITEPHKRRKETSDDDATTSEGDSKTLLEEAKQLKHQGDKHKQTSEGVTYYLHSALTYTRATLMLPPKSRPQLYRATAQLLSHSVSGCLARDDEQRAALCYEVMAFCYARLFTLHREQCERNVRQVRSLDASAVQQLGTHLEDLFRCLEFWDNARKHAAGVGQRTITHPLDTRTSELIEHVTQILNELKQQ